MARQTRLRARVGVPGVGRDFLPLFRGPLRRWVPGGRTGCHAGVGGPSVRASGPGGDSR